MSAPNTLADVLAAIKSDTELSQREQQDMAWAIRHVGRTLGVALSDISASPPVLTNRLKAVEPAAAGVSGRTWSNVRSQLRKALRHTGAFIEPGRHKGQLTSDWQQLLDAIDVPWLRYGLSRFAHFASDNGWAPGEIGDAHFAVFRDALENHSICRTPERAAHRAMINWNKAAREVPGWPPTEITIRTRDPGYTFDWDAFPPQLLSEVDDYFRERSGSDPFGTTGLKPLAEVSAQTQKFQLRQLASAMVHREAATCDELVSLAALVEPDRYKAGLRFFYERQCQQRSTQLTQIANAGLGAARYLVQRGAIDQSEFDAVHHAYKRVEYRGSGMSERNRERLRPFADPDNVAALITLPDRLAKRCGSTATVRDAYRMRTALAIELLLIFPMRVRNLATLNLDQHVTRTQANGKGRTFLHLPGMEVKNRETLQVELPSRTAKLLDSYVHSYRPLLVRDNGAWLFPGREGSHQHIAAFGTYLKTAIKRETGLTVHPHLFRHLAAKLYLDANPGQFEVVRQVLGHRSLKTTVETYAEFDSQQAVEMYDQHILALQTKLVGSVEDTDHG
ncbi:hypothetical protein CKO28_18500 [Rhodovibrio sodomensis]|uniref:Tyr recombinase domain-containing protein n=1 Tax=Rhodovibrio sodomensis TaxID=1088 RepID=A0ABS1DJY4_9PROT|nr:site-specific integrase [Rhodovibrio sodomensis]MBK1670028.1 hypothetical protein [Rhodovibrio sodomensis]